MKADAGMELLAAVKALREGEWYISARLVGRVFFDVPEYSSQGHGLHKLQIYSSDEAFLDGYASFVGGGLSSGNAVVVLATEAHRLGLSPIPRALGFYLTAGVQTCSY